MKFVRTLFPKPPYLKTKPSQSSRSASRQYKNTATYQPDFSWMRDPPPPPREYAALVQQNESQQQPLPLLSNAIPFPVQQLKFHQSPPFCRSYLPILTTHFIQPTAQLPLPTLVMLRVPPLPIRTPSGSLMIQFIHCQPSSNKALRIRDYTSSDFSINNNLGIISVTIHLAESTHCKSHISKFSSFLLLPSQ